MGAELTIIGNGTPHEAAAFYEDLLAREVRLLTDPNLTSYNAMELKRSLFAVSQPRTYLRGFQVSLRGFRGAKRQGDSLQQGGAFVITPDHDVPFSFFCSRPDEHADSRAILETLGGLEGKSWGWSR